MGASDKLFTRFIPKEQVASAASWEFEPLGGTSPSRGAQRLLTERERRAFERGRVQGQTEGQAAAMQVRATHARQIENVLGELRARYAELESDGADAVLDLAVEIARQVVRREVTVARDLLLPLVRDAVAAVIDQQAHPRVHLNPQDLELIAADLDADGLCKGCRFIADARVERGGCRIETQQGEIDGGVATRWRRVMEALGMNDVGLGETQIQTHPHPIPPPEGEGEDGALPAGERKS